jgi:hypothetical protein
LLKSAASVSNFFLFPIQIPHLAASAQEFPAAKTLFGLPKPAFLPEMRVSA